MNTLIYISIDDAVAAIQANSSLQDGTIIVAHPGTIERRGEPSPDVVTCEQHAESSDWKRVWGDGTYNYHLLVARKGITPVRDRQGDEIGYRVNGTQRGN